MADLGLSGVDQAQNSVPDDMEREDDHFALPDDEAVMLGQTDADILQLEEDQEVVSEMADSALGLGSVAFNQDDGEEEAVNPEELCPEGVLTEEAIETGLSNLGRSAEGTHQVFLQLTLAGFNLKDISILNEYIHMQKVELPYNELTDLVALGNMPYLLQLDVSHNQLTSLLNFKPPKNLQIANCSFNKLEEMTDLSAHHCLHSLILDNNNISEIKGLEKCHRLHKLSLAHNHIEKIQGIENLPIQELNLSCNDLKRIENIDTLKYLRCAYFSGNQIRSLTGLQGHEFLETVDMEDNEIIDLSEVQFIRDLKLLRNLNLQRNPIRELPDYRLSILFHIQQLTELDNRRVDVEEKVAAGNMFNPPMEVIAARDHIMHVVYSFLQPSRLLDSTLPSIETPYPMLVLVGPQGAGKKDLALKLVEEFPDYFGYGVPHTTRRPIGDEEQGKDFNFVSLEEFEATIKMGKFLQTYSYHGELYGVTIDAVEAVAREGLACVTQMELEGVLTLKNTYFEPRYVMVLPLSADSHEKRLRERDTYSESQIEQTLNRADVYADYNRDHPGFFDMVINSDDIIDAYKKLRQLVMDYLGIGGSTPSVSDFDPSNTELNLLEKDFTNDTINVTAGNSAKLTRTWSKPSLSESATQQTLLNMKTKLQSPAQATGRGIVEEESLRRRQSAAKEAVSGANPTIYDQLLQSVPQTVPEQMTAGLGDYNSKDKMNTKRSYSAPTHNMDALPPCSPDSSESRSGADSSLSNISEARDIEDEPGSLPPSQPQTPQDSKDDLNLPAEAIDMLTLMSSSASKNRSAGSVPMAPRPSSGEPRGIVLEPGSRPTSGRPGSERHRVLPPIGQSADY